MNPNSYAVGTQVTLTGTFTTQAGNLVDPTTVTAEVCLPDRQIIDVSSSVARVRALVCSPPITRRSWPVATATKCRAQATARSLHSTHLSRQSYSRHEHCAHSPFEASSLKGIRGGHHHSAKSASAPCCSSSKTSTMPRTTPQPLRSTSKSRRLKHKHALAIIPKAMWLSMA